MDIGAWLERLDTLTITVLVDRESDLELANQPTHSRQAPCLSPSCDCKAVYAARARLSRAGIWTRGQRGGFHPPAPRRNR